MLQVKPFHIRAFLPLPYQEALAPRLRRAHQHLQARLSRPPEEGVRLTRVLTDAGQLRRDSQALVVLDSGGAALGAQGVIRCLRPQGPEAPALYFLDRADPGAVREVLASVEGRDFSVAASNSGAETGAVLRCFRQALEARYGRPEAERRIYASPPREAEQDDPLSPAGLLPMAAAGVDVTALLQGAAEMAEQCAAGSYESPAWQYAALRYELYRTGRPIEILACRDPAYCLLLEWWKRLFSGGGEKGILPVTGFTGALPLGGQAPQWDKRPLFETVLRPEPSPDPPQVPDGTFGDGLDFLAGESLDYISGRALEGALLAHTESGVPCVVLEAGKKTPEALGRLIRFFQYVQDLCQGLWEGEVPVRPEPAAYQSNLSALLGQPGCAGRRAMLEERLRAGAVL